LSLPPEGDRPGGEEPFEGIPPDDVESAEDVHKDLPDLESEFLRSHSDTESESEGDDEPASEPEPTDEFEQPAMGGSAEPSSEDPEEPDEEEPKEEEEPEPGGEGEGEEGEEADGAEDADKDAAEDVGKTVEFTPQEVSEAEQSEAAPQPPPAAAAPPPVPVAAAAPPAASTPPPSAPITPGVPRKPPPEGDSEPTPKRKRLWWRFALGSFLIVASSASAVALTVVFQLKDIAEALQPIPKVKQLLQEVHGGDPENMLILGSDKRASLPGSKGLSDTTILLRLDPDNRSIALMSIPRDLKVYIPGYGVNKFNAAYAFGGPKLTLRVVKNLTGLPINHVVNVDFLGFQRAINAIDCVYIDVDRRYYHSNVGLPPSLQYSEINIQPGYQRLCGQDALSYVRYRHTDTDLVRAARQQDFLREARGRVPLSSLVLSGKRQELIDIFTRYTSSDIDGWRTMLDVLNLLIASRNAPIKEIHFPGILHPSYVTASKSSIAEAVNKFVGIQASGGPRGALNLPQSSGNTGIVPEEKKRAKAGKKQKKQKASPTPSKFNDGLVDASQFSHDLAAKVAAKTLHSFPVFYPKRLPAGSIYAQVPRVYHLHDTDGHKVGAYKEVLQIPQGDYFGVQGLHGWTNPPILKDPSETRKIDGRDYDIYLDGDRVRLISWQQGDNVYWVSNSLLQTLTNDQMLGIARSVGKLPGERHKAKKHKKSRR
jgi:polyisoprenyl-teichoic acid--peptidoglycan teichoic acid transferase